MTAPDIRALLDADAERAGKVGALAGAELIRWDITRRCCEARHAGTWGRSYDLDPSLCKTCAETIDKVLALVTESPWLVERLRARDEAIRAVLKALDDEPLIVSGIRRDLARTPSGRGGELHHRPGTPRVGRAGCPGDNLTDWLDDLRVALASALGGGEQQ